MLGKYSYFLTYSHSYSDALRIDASELVTVLAGEHRALLFKHNNLVCLKNA